MSKKTKKVLSNRNPIVRNAYKFNKPKVFKDRKKAAKNDNYGERHCFSSFLYDQKKVDIAA